MRTHQSCKVALHSQLGTCLGERALAAMLRSTPTWSRRCKRSLQHHPWRRKHWVLLLMVSETSNAALHCRMRSWVGVVRFNRHNELPLAAGPILTQEWRGWQQADNAVEPLSVLAATHSSFAVADAITASTAGMADMTETERSLPENVSSSSGGAQNAYEPSEPHIRAGAMQNNL